ncbi:uncharacterized protein LOC116618729 [Nematostella vectensis]|uniref:uncharacterized protein LOC116618729 n=1 Tax=Nematostella vectensis TaxID=45351 RepID=UPI00139065B8|nr:uncharacterized protein LOC116618729 [Nematostella vectensis]XP_048581334.1 uncharacterized protein LOC116618729 [Nematostella vectensis]XP_048581335.1 uncharacterized protein LOC116618729 [Nematostella vectensis]
MISSRRQSLSRCYCYVLTTVLVVYAMIQLYFEANNPVLIRMRPASRNHSCFSTVTAKQNYNHLCLQRENSTVRVGCRGLHITLYCDIQELSEPCQKWTWDVSNKTLRYSDPIPLQSGICTVPIVNSQVRKIIYPNSSYRLPGCDNAKSCDWPYYDKALHMRINTDPCCREILINMTYRICLLLDRYSIHHVLISGAVIGWYRDHSFLPYDHDIDIIIDIQDKKRFEDLVNSSFSKEGFELEPVRKSSDFFWVWPKGRKIIGPDVWYYSTDKNDITIGYKKWRQPVAYVLPRQRGFLEGYQFWFPAQPEKYLDTEYGKGKWRNVLQCKVMDGKTCVE